MHHCLEKADASFTLQAALRRKAAQGINKEIKVAAAKNKIGASVKRLLTERAETIFNPSTNQAYIKNKSTIGQPLAYSDRQKRLVSKQRRDAAIEGYKRN